MEREVDLIIRAARRPAPGEPSGCDAAQVLRDRIGFWSALAEDQGRPCQLIGADRPVRVPVPRSDLAAAADALIGNVFRHTAEGTGFAVTLHPGRDVVLIFFADAGPGIGNPNAALRRGSSGAGSAGLAAAYRPRVDRPRSRHRPPRRRVHRRRTEDRPVRPRRRPGPAVAADRRPAAAPGAPPGPPGHHAYQLLSQPLSAP